MTDANDLERARVSTARTLDSIAETLGAISELLDFDEEEARQEAQALLKELRRSLLAASAAI